MLALIVQANAFLLLGHAQADDDVDDLQDDERGDDAEDPSDADGDELAFDDGAAFDQAELGAGAPLRPMSQQARVANTPVRMAPSVPPTPCTPKASSESS